MQDSNTPTPTPTPPAPLSPTSRTRVILAAATMAIPALTIALSHLAWAVDLPERVASHWSGSGVPDDSMLTANVFISALVAASLAFVATVVVLALPRPSMRAKRVIVLLIGTVAGMAASIWLVPTWLTVQAGSVEGAELGFWIVPLGLCSLWGIIPAVILPAQPLHFGAAAVPPRLELGETEVGAWSRSITALMFVWVTIGVVAICAAISIPLLLEAASGVATFGLVIMVVAALACASFIRLRVSVDWRGLRVVSVLGIPMKRIPLDQIEVVEATEIRPMEWGGWGYRVLPGRSAIVLRSGPGLVVTTSNEKQFAITLADPEQPAALLQALASRAAAKA